MNWIIMILVALLIYIGFDYGRLTLKSRRQQKECNQALYEPTRYIMVGAKGSQYIQDLSMLDVKAHAAVGIGVMHLEDRENEGYVKTVFENGDELIVYCYDKAQIAPLTKREINEYRHKIFFDYMLPEVAERAIIKQLGLLDYMVNIGICSEKSGGK